MGKHAHSPIITHTQTQMRETVILEDGMKLSKLLREKQTFSQLGHIQNL